MAVCFASKAKVWREEFKIAKVHSIADRKPQPIWPKKPVAAPGFKELYSGLIK